MKTKSVRKTLGRFRSHGVNNTIIYTSRANNPITRYVELVDQDGEAFCLPIVVQSDGYKRVSFHATTIKSLVEFLEGGAS